MSVVRSNNNNRRGVNSALSILGSVIAAALNGNPAVYTNAYETGKVIGNYLRGPKDGGGNIPFPQPQSGGGNSRQGGGRSGKTRKRGRGREKKQSRDNVDTFRTIGFGPTSTVPTLRTTMTGCFAITVTPPTAYASRYWLSYENGGGASLFTFLSADSVRLLGAFEKALVHKVSVRYVGTVSSTTSGYFAIGMDSSTDASVGNAASIGALMNANQLVTVCDIKGETSLTYVPKGSDREIRLLDTSASSADKLAGRLQMMLGGHNLASQTEFGLLYYSVDITLLQ